MLHKSSLFAPGMDTLRVKLLNTLSKNTGTWTHRDSGEYSIVALCKHAKLGIVHVMM